MRLSRAAILALAAFLLAADMSSAHHATSAIFEVTKRVPITGTLTRVQWINPHIFVFVDVQAGGKVQQWKVEANPPAWWRGVGVNRADFAKGLDQKVTVEGHPARDGTPYLYLRKITFANGDSLEAVQTL
jgi:2-keto-4-pentenoate hydratase